jgi:hypothetical protein
MWGISIDNHVDGLGQTVGDTVIVIGFVWT